MLMPVQHKVLLAAKLALKKLYHAVKRSSAASVIDLPLAIILISSGALGGLSEFLRSGHVSHGSWFRILRAHCLTNGRSTDILKLITRATRPPRGQKDIAGLLGPFSVEQQNAVVASLKRDGYFVFPQLIPGDFCDQVQAFATGVDTIIEGNWDLKNPLIHYDPTHPVSRTYKIRESDSVGNSAIQRLLADPVFIAIAEAYLGTHPTIGGVNLWWSALYGNAPGSDAAQLFHFDFDAPPAWLKLFVYITDVGPENGPHVYVRGSHKPAISKAREFRARGYERIEDEEMLEKFGADALVEILGKRGTVFMADTRGFHKGKFPRGRDRLIVQLLYCSPVYNDRGAGPALPENPEPELAAALATMPRVYDRFGK